MQAVEFFFFFFTKMYFFLQQNTDTEGSYNHNHTDEAFPFESGSSKGFRIVSNSSAS